MLNTYVVDGHTIEFSQGSGSLNPWSSEYCTQINLSIVCTSDIVPYMRIDGEKIYKLHRHYSKYLDLLSILETNVLTWEEITTVFKDLFSNFSGNFSEMKQYLDVEKKKEEEFKKLSQEEKKNVIKKWRADRKTELERIKKEENSK